MAVANKRAALATYLLLRRIRRSRVRRRIWTHPIIAYRRSRGVQCNLIEDELEKYPAKFFNFFRMSVSSFHELLGVLEPHLRRQDTHLRKAISPKERLAVTLRYLATGCSLRELFYVFRIGVSTLSGAIREVCQKLWEVVRPVEIPIPTQQKWEEIATLFEERADFPNCIGAVDGKHIRIMKPAHSGSMYFNYKKYFSFVLLGICDADYCFTLVDIGDYGKRSDSSIFKDSKISELMTTNKLNIPPSKPLPESTAPHFPMVFVGDEAFSLSYYVMRPYAGKILSKKKRIFNYRLTRARRFIECTFGLLANKWRILHRALNVSEDFAVDIVKACVVLHNYVRRRDGINSNDTLMTSGMEDMRSTGNFERVGQDMRDAFADYFVGAGALPWQESKI